MYLLCTYGNQCTNFALMSLTLKSVRSGRTDCIGELPLTRKQDRLLSSNSVVMYAILMLVFLTCNCMVTTKSVKYHTRALHILIAILVWWKAGRILSTPCSVFIVSLTSYPHNNLCDSGLLWRHNTRWTVLLVLRTAAVVPPPPYRNSPRMEHCHGVRQTTLKRKPRWYDLMKLENYQKITKSLQFNIKL